MNRSAGTINNVVTTATTTHQKSACIPSRDAGNHQPIAKAAPNPTKYGNKKIPNRVKPATNGRGAHSLDAPSTKVWVGPSTTCWFTATHIGKTDRKMSQRHYYAAEGSQYPRLCEKSAKNPV